MNKHLLEGWRSCDGGGRLSYKFVPTAIGWDLAPFGPAMGDSTAMWGGVNYGPRGLGDSSCYISQCWAEGHMGCTFCPMPQIEILSLCWALLSLWNPPSSSRRAIYPDDAIGNCLALYGIFVWLSNCNSDRVGLFTAIISPGLAPMISILAALLLCNLEPSEQVWLSPATMEAQGKDTEQYMWLGDANLEGDWDEVGEVHGNVRGKTWRSAHIPDQVHLEGGSPWDQDRHMFSMLSEVAFKGEWWILWIYCRHSNRAVKMKVRRFNKVQGGWLSGGTKGI